MSTFSLLVCLLLMCLSVVVNSFDLTLLHTNDVHARIEQINKYGGQCSEENANEGKCFGGYPRLKTKVKELRASHPNTLLLDAGDQYSGSMWFTEFGGQGIGTFMNYLGYDAMALGNHEFDRGTEGLIPFLDTVNFTVLSSNIRHMSDSLLKGRFEKSKVFNVGGEKIGIIGYTTRETPFISSSGPKTTFENEVDAIRTEVTLLKQQGVNKIIALGHSGFNIDRKIAAEVSDLDVVVGGHTNTFLYTGDAPSNEDPAGDYPHVVTQTNGAKVLVVQDYAFGKYLGELRLTFDTQGVVTSWNGNPILLDKNTARDPDTVTFLEPYRQAIENATHTIIGKTHVLLDGERKNCRVRECNLGNLIADAMVKQNIRHSDSLYWNDVSIAVANSGGIRASIQKGDISLGHAGFVMPFSNTIDIVELYGRDLLAVLEHSASKLTDPYPVDFGGFLQVSGLKIEYDIHRPVGNRVKRARALCTRCDVPRYEDIRKDDIYKVITNNFIANGGDKYVMIPEKRVKYHQIGDLDLDVFVEYIKEYSPIIHGEEERIIFTYTEPCVWPSSGSSSSVSFSLVLIWLVALLTL